LGKLGQNILRTPKNLPAPTPMYIAIIPTSWQLAEVYLCQNIVKYFCAKPHRTEENFLVMPKIAKLFFARSSALRFRLKAEVG